MNEGQSLGANAGGRRSRAGSVEKEDDVILREIFVRADKEIEGTLDLQQYLWAVEEARRSMPILIRAPSDVVADAFYTRATLKGVDVSAFKDAIDAIRTHQFGSTHTSSAYKETLQRADSLPRDVGPEAASSNSSDTYDRGDGGTVSDVKDSRSEQTDLRLPEDDSETTEPLPSLPAEEDDDDVNPGATPDADAHNEAFADAAEASKQHVASEAQEDESLPPLPSSAAADEVNDDPAAPTSPLDAAAPSSPAMGDSSADPDNTEVEASHKPERKGVKFVGLEEDEIESSSGPAVAVAVETDDDGDLDDEEVAFVEVNFDGAPAGDDRPRKSFLRDRNSSGGSFVSSIASTSRSIGVKVGQWFGVLPPEDNGLPTLVGGSSGHLSREGSHGHRNSNNSFLRQPANQRTEQTARNPRDEVDFDVHDMFDPSDPATATLPTSLFGEVMDDDGETPLISDYHAALMAYRRYIAREKVFKRKRLQRTLTDESESSGARSVYTASRSVNGAPSRRSGLEEDIKLQLRSLPTFTPRFIPAMTFVQLCIICAMLFDSYSVKEFARIGLGAVKSKCSTEVGGIPTCPLDYRGLADTAAEQVEPANLWIGPEAGYLIRFGGRFAPCMRPDVDIRGKTSRVRLMECGTTVEQCDDPTLAGGQGYSCCVYEARAYGMLSNSSCRDNGGVWLDDRGRHRQCSELSEPSTIRPCCLGSTGTCQLLTESQCEFHSGVYHTDKQLCSEVPCLVDTCTPIIAKQNAPRTADEDHNDVPNPNQWWRFIWPIFMHAGVIHYILCMLIQWVVGNQIERTAGWLRVLLIYFTSGIGGYIISGLFDPLSVAVGSDPAVFGLLAVLYVELFQSWRMVPNPKTELTKLVTIVSVGLFIGTLPFVDNFAQLGGFVFGILASIVFLPYITFGKWDYRRKRVLLYISGPILITLFLSMLIMFYLVQDADCQWCKSINCVAYTSDVHCN
eukprot:m.130011 g.130011  ORF g.130011 m.130011 type:complete len:961 (+) comp13696_c0_seq1:200-3082(+)